MAAGCDNVSLGPPAKPKPKVVVKTILTPENAKSRKVRKDPQEELAVIDKAFQKSRDEVRLTGAPEEVAVRRVTDEIEKYLEVGPTLVVWVVDRTNSSYKLVTAALPAARAFYDSEPIRQLALGDEKGKLLTAVVAYDDKAEFLLDPPSDKPDAAAGALTKATAGMSGKELTFGTIKAVLAKYDSLRAEPRQLVLVLISDEAGEDASLVDELAAQFKKQAIPLYAIGSPAPWGQTNPFAKPGAKPDPAAASADAFPTHGPESLFSERVHLPLPPAGFTFRSRDTDELIDSGFGPFGIERLCRAGGGAFLAVRPKHAEFAAFGSQQFWPTGSEMRFEGSAAKYAPDYVSAEEYQKLLSANGARKALHEAAKIGRAEILDNPNVIFAKQGNEAQMKRLLDEAQQAAARVAPQLDRLYDVLQAGESDRDQLDSPRWQVQFDYAFGRVLAAKCRNDGYNQMLAALKAGKGPKDATEYVLEPADHYETSSALKKMADKAKLYLERVVKEHPGTPWAKLAEEDLKAPMGWKWQGS